MTHKSENGLRCIKKLLDYTFVVGDYQRGYKWTEQQVNDLLNDIHEFKGRDSSFYCLQLVVVKKTDDDKYELIDGQQRITTIYLIISFLQSILPLKDKKPFTIEYNTRPSSATFLGNIKTHGKKTWDELAEFDNIDNWHFHQAYQSVMEFFTDWNSEEQNEFKKKLIDQANVIWYEVLSNEGPIDIFRNLNSGKIPLTNSELIKALFLHEIRNEHADSIRLNQDQIANEWDRIEATLQDKRFWFFINKDANKERRSSRIGFLFDFLKNKPKSKYDDEYFTYNEYCKAFKGGASRKIVIKDEWEEVRNLFQRFEEWYNDDELYHLVGFVISAGFKDGELENLNAKSKDFSKSNFRKYLKNIIKENLFKEIVKEPSEGKYDWSILNYHDTKEQLRNILLLFNIETLNKIKDCSVRFPFHLFAREQWSLEHIHAQNSMNLEKKEQIDVWIEEMKKNLPHKEGDSIGNRFLEWFERYKDVPDSSQATKERIEIQDEVDQMVWGDDIDIMHSIENMALLVKSHNSKLNNAWFATKRERTLILEKGGDYIPVCTQRVFSKYYTESPESLLKWTKADREAYRCAIEETLKPYLSE